MTHSQTDDSARATDTYLLFAHEAYYPDSGTQEINTTVVAADSLLHPQVRQPDGARMHDCLTRGRQLGEIIPLSALTHELDGGASWPAVGDWGTSPLLRHAERSAGTWVAADRRWGGFMRSA